MASPVDSARTGTNITTAATSHTINVGSPASGNLLIVFVRFAGAPGTVTFTGYTQLVADTSDASDDDTRIYYRWADGTEGTTDPMSTGNSIKLAAICWVITGAENPATTAPGVSAVVVGTAANVDPGAAPPNFDLDVTGSTSGNTNIQGDGGVTNDRQAQSFVAGGTTIISVAVKIAKVLSPSDNLVVEIQTDSSGSPSGSVVGTVATISGASLSTTASVVTNSCSISVSSGSTYWIVLRRTGSPDTSNYYTWSSAPDATYASGTSKRNQSSAWLSNSVDQNFGISWSVATSKDYLFLTVIGMDHETATATQPTGYSNLAAANSGTGGAVATNCMIWGASKQATATSDDPGAWTSTAPNSGVTAFTLAIPPTTPVDPNALQQGFAMGLGASY